MIIPKETAWFQFYDEKYNVEGLEDSKFYKEDFIGVRKLNEEGKINFDYSELNLEELLLVSEVKILTTQKIKEDKAGVKTVCPSPAPKVIYQKYNL